MASQTYESIMESLGNTIGKCFVSCLALLCVTGCDVSVNLVKSPDTLELQQVLEYYSSREDKEKYMAARFLVDNMPGHRHMRGGYRAFYDMAEKLIDASDTVVSGETLKVLSENYSVDYPFDTEHVTAEFLIDHIDKAFEAWRNGGWAGHLGFDEFCEILLPYTCSNTQPLDQWRDSLYSFALGPIEYMADCKDYYGNPKAAVISIADSLKNYISHHTIQNANHGLHIYDSDLLVKVSGAVCEEYVQMGTLIMRSKGLPVTIDFTPQWPDRQNGHHWISFLGLDGNTVAMDPFFMTPEASFRLYGKYSKVLRRTYSPDPDYMSLLRRHGGDVPRMFRDPFFRDVTEEYSRTYDLKIKLLPGIRTSGRDVYIAVFDNSEWTPVFWGRRCGRKAVFKNMGTDVLYMAMAYREGILVPASVPFHVDVNGIIKYFSSEDANPVAFRLWRKYPMYRHVFKIERLLHGGVISGANHADFSDGEVIAEIPEWPITSGMVKLNQSIPYRYWSFAPPKDTCDMAELFFFENETGGHWRQIIPADSLSELLCDNDQLSYSSVGIFDMGKPMMFDHLSYIRRGDGNSVSPGDVYQLFYWEDSRWILFREYHPEDICIDVEGIPKGRLYYIKNISRGAQNRVFAVEETTKKIEWL